MAYPTPVNSRITDAVTQQNLQVLGSASTMAMASIYQSSAHSISIAFENAVQAQRQASICGQAAANAGVMQVYSMGAMSAASATMRIAPKAPAPNPVKQALTLLVAARLLNL